MAMTAGTISVATNGTYTGSGLALDVMDDLVAEYEQAFVDLNAPDPPVAERYKALQGLARLAAKFALVITYIQANARTGTDNETIV